MIQAGDCLRGFCEGVFGRDSYADKRVEAVGYDWVVARNLESYSPEFARVDPESLRPFLISRPEKRVRRDRR